MIIVIDGYNLLKQALGKQQVADRDRAHFITALSKYAVTKKHKILLFFDGGPYEWNVKEKVQGITVIYSGVNDNADECIKRYLTANAALDILLVSTDRALNVYARHRGIESLDSLDFYMILQEALYQEPVQRSKRSSAVKTTRQESSELDILMESMPIEQKAEDFVQQERAVSKGTTLSKQERAIARKLKKL